METIVSNFSRAMLALLSIVCLSALVKTLLGILNNSESVLQIFLKFSSTTSG
jgi:hypothetical protein